MSAVVVLAEEVDVRLLRLGRIHPELHGERGVQTHQQRAAVDVVLPSVQDKALTGLSGLLSRIKAKRSAVLDTGFCCPLSISEIVGSGS